MGTNAAAVFSPLVGSENTMDDVDLLRRLSGVQAGLLRCRWQASTVRTRIHQEWAYITQVESILQQVDKRALAALRFCGDVEPVSTDARLCQNALGDDQGAYESARDQSTRSADAIRALLTRLYQKIGNLERDKETLRAKLSLWGARTYELLMRQEVLPFLTHVTDGSCGECRLTLPTILVSSILGRGNSCQCPSCGRLLVPQGPTNPSLR